MNLNCREHGEAATICHLNYWIIWAFSLHPSIIWKQNCWQFILKLAECPGAGEGHLIGVFSRDNGEVRVNKLQQRQIKNIWLINSSVQCGAGQDTGPQRALTRPTGANIGSCSGSQSRYQIGQNMSQSVLCPSEPWTPSTIHWREEKCS